MHGTSNRDTHLYPPHNISSVCLTTTTYVRRSGRITNGMWIGRTTLQDSAFLSPTPTPLEWPSEEEPRSSYQAPVVWKLAQPQTAGPRYIRGRRTIYSYFTSNAKPWAPDGMFSSIKYEHFIQVSSNQKHVFIMSTDVRCGQESISKQLCYILPAVMLVSPAVTHAFRRVRK